jgi:RHS repeat-associated protein
VNRFLYNGKELQVGTGLLDYGARMYMPEIGRWGVADPLSEIAGEFSPFLYGNDNPVLMIDPNGMLTTYNWNTGRYEDEHGGNVGFEQAKHEYGIGGSSGCPPNCPQNVAKADATGRAQNTITPQIADGGIALSRSEQATLYNADLKYQHGTQFSEYEKAAHIGIDIAGMAQFGLLVKNVKALITSVKTGGQLWTSTSKLSSVENAFKHWKDHGAEFPELVNAKQYVEATKSFLHNSPAGTLTKTRTNGDILKYNSGTNTFGVIDVSGTPRTMFKPTGGMQYWLKQN